MRGKSLVKNNLYSLLTRATEDTPGDLAERFDFVGKVQFGQEISRGIFPIGHKRNAIFAPSNRLIEKSKYKNIFIFSF